ncbi:hypothetical protein JCM10213_008162 [Rhodosporidiobolus nylandii]
MALRPFGTLSSVSQSAGTPIRLAEGLCEAAEEGDVERTVIALKRLDGQGGEVNGKSSKTGLSALVTVASKEQSPVNVLLLRILRLKGAKLPSSDGGTDGSWLEVVQPWAIELLEGSTAGEGDEENEAVKLLTREPAEAKKHVAWVDEDVKPDISSSGSFAKETERPPSVVRHPILKLRTGSRFQHYRSTSTAFSSSPSSTPLPPISEAFDSSPIDLTTSRTPSPAPQPAKERLLAPIPRRPLKRAPSPSSPSPSNDPVSRAPTSDARAHLRIDNLPASVTRASILDLFTDTSGVVDARIVLPEGGSRFALVSFSSTSLAQHGSARKRGLEIEGRKVELSLWNKDGQPLADYREVLPVVSSRGLPAAPGTGVGAGSGGGANGGQRAVRPRRPYVPLLHRAAELQRRLYFGSLPPEITKEELAGLIGGSSGFALERVVRIDRAPDGSHAFAFVQFPDAVTATSVRECLHGTFLDGHLVWATPANEIHHEWLFSLSIRGLPAHWGYRDVCDFLAATLGNFAGLAVRHTTTPYGEKRLELALVELRYKTELSHAFESLCGRVVDNRVIDVSINQLDLRHEIEGELARKRLFENAATGGGWAGPSHANDPHKPSFDGSPSGQTAVMRFVTPVVQSSTPAVVVEYAKGKILRPNSTAARSASAMSLDVPVPLGKGQSSAFGAIGEGRVGAEKA